VTELDDPFSRGYYGDPTTNAGGLMELLKDIPVKLRSADISQRLRLREKDNRKEVQNLIEVTQPLIAARAAYRVSFVEAKHDNAVSIDGVRLTSRVLRKNLDPVQRVFPGKA
jgi:hypothetical protein